MLFSNNLLYKIYKIMLKGVRTVRTKHYNYFINSNDSDNVPFAIKRMESK